MRGGGFFFAVDVVEPTWMRSPGRSKTSDRAHTAQNFRSALRSRGFSVDRWVELAGLWVMVRSRWLEAPECKGALRKHLANQDRAVPAILGEG